MAKKKSTKPKTGWSLSTLFWTLTTAITGGGVGGYINPELPVVGPLVRNCLKAVTANVSTSSERPNDGAPSGRPLTDAQVPITGVATTTQPISSRRPSDKLLIATFNIQVFGVSKLAKAQVMSVIVQVLRQFDVVAIQEVRAKEDHILPTLVAELNADGSRYNFLIGPRLGRTVSTEQYSFVYDTNRVEYDPSSVGTFRDPQDLLHREPFVARFRSRTNTPDRAFSFLLIDTHTDPDEVKAEVDTLADVFRVMQSSQSFEDDVILLGDLNASETQLGKLGQIPGIRWAVQGAMTNTRQNRAYDNILFHGPSTREFTGRWGVYDLAKSFQLTTEEALEISDHFPVWAEFDIWEAPPQSQVAERAPGPIR